MKSFFLSHLRKLIMIKILLYILYTAQESQYHDIVTTKVRYCYLQGQQISVKDLGSLASRLSARGMNRMFVARRNYACAG